MKDILKYIPGFRSDKKWKKAIAIIYYIFCLLMLLGGVGVFLVMTSMPFIGFAIIRLIKHRNKSVILTLIAGTIMFSYGIKLVPATSESSTKQAATSKVTPEVKAKTAEKIKKEADTEAQIKLIASEKIIADTKAKADNEIKGELKVHFIDVGQADSILIQQNGQNMLIDAGNNEDDKLVVEYLKKQGVQKIDILIGTHLDEDHIGGLDTVIKTFNIGEIYMPKTIKPTATFKDVVTAITNKQMKVSVPKVGEAFKLGNSECTILAPNETDYADANNYSIVTKLKFGNTSFIFMGDAEELSEGQILQKQLDIKSDVIKIGHHGSDTSTTQKFLDTVNPKYAVISVGKGNSYGHPTQEVMNRLKAKNIGVYRTDECGTIVATSNGKDISFNTKVGSYNGLVEKVAEKTETKVTPKVVTKTVPKKAVVVVVPKPVPKTVVKPITKPKETKPSNSGVMVWLSATGSKYHSINNCGRMNPNTARQVTLEEAKKGYDACSKCDPPQ